MRVNVLFFARARELAATGSSTIDLDDGATVTEALAVIEGAFPALAGLLERCRVAVDEEMVSNDARLAPEAVLAIIPPVSGG